MLRACSQLSIALLFTAVLTNAALAQGRPQGGRPPQDPPKEEDAPVDEGPKKVIFGERLPELEATDWANYEGKPSLHKLRDRIIVLYFFRTDDAQSVDAFAKLNELHKSQAQRGVTVIALTPEKKEVAESVVKGKEVSFIVGYGADTAGRYDVSTFPKVYLLDTAGRLVNRFHPGEELQEKVVAQIAKTPPPGADPEAQRARLEAALAAREKKEYGKAFTLGQDVLKTSGADSELGKRAADLVKQVTDDAKQWLEEARDAGKDDKKLDRACTLLAELSVRFQGEALAADADTEIGKLMADGKLKPKLRKAIDNAKGQLKNDLAADHEAGKRYLEALKLYREVSEDHPDTEAAQAAEQAVERITSDKDVQRRIAAVRADDEAERWLDLADRFARVEMYEQARAFCQRVVDEHPDSRAAPRAKQRLAKLPKTSPADADEAPAKGASKAKPAGGSSAP